MKNLYEFKEAVDFSQYQKLEDLFTAGEGEAYGIEFFFNKRAGRLNGWLGYSLSWTKRLFPEINNGKVFYPRYDRRHDISAVIAYKIFDNTTVSATWTFATGQAYTVPIGQYSFTQSLLNPASDIYLNYTTKNAFRLPDYHKLDLNITHKIVNEKNELEFYLSLLNVYNRQNTFSFYTTVQTDENGNKTLKVKKLTLFPFIPSFGFTYKF